MLPLAGEEEPVRFVVIDDEPHYRARQPAIEIADRLLQVGDYGSVDTFLAVQREPCHVVVLDLCLDNRRSDRTVTQGVVAVRLLAEQFGHWSWSTAPTGALIQSLAALRPGLWATSVSTAPRGCSSPLRRSAATAESSPPD